MISAVIITWNSELYIERCIADLYASVTNAGFGLEVFVVDNGSNDSTVALIEKLRSSISNINLIKLSKNHGTTYSRNIALKQVKGEYVIILDSDIECMPDTVRVLVDALNQDKTIGIASPKLVYSDGKLQVSYKKIPTAKTKFYKLLGSKISFFRKLAQKDEEYGIWNQQFYPDYCISAYWCLRKEALSKIGYLDEHIFYAPEDVDYCVRSWLSGYRVAYVPAAVAIHHTQRVSYSKIYIGLNHLRGLFYFFNKYNCWFSRKKLYASISGVFPFRITTSVREHDMDSL